MESIQEHISRLSLKIQQLVKHMAALEKENDQYKKELQLLRNKVAQSDTQISQLKEQNYILKSATQSLSPAEKAALELSITRYVREIDKCISLLSE